MEEQLALFDFTPDTAYTDDSAGDIAYLNDYIIAAGATEREQQIQQNQ